APPLAGARALTNKQESFAERMPHGELASPQPRLVEQPRILARTDRRTDRAGRPCAGAGLRRPPVGRGAPDRLGATPGHVGGVAAARLAETVRASPVLRRPALRPARTVRLGTLRLRWPAALHAVHCLPRQPL